VLKNKKMKKINYAKFCSQALQELSARQREVISRRFALSGQKKEKETLESIGRDLKVTRERVRQIERDVFASLNSGAKKRQSVFEYFENYLKKSGGLKKEDTLLTELGAKEEKNEIYFLLSLDQNLKRFSETAELYSFWVLDKVLREPVQKTINSIYEKLKKNGQPLKGEELAKLNSLDSATIASFLAIAKKIQKNAKGFYGLKDWPEINPKRIKDKAYFALRDCHQPLHFAQVASLIDSALPQTVHNELIKDTRFVLVGRGIYALKEWGYEKGLVKDVISNILKSAGRPLGREEVVEKTLQQRLVKANTVLLNLGNKKYFSKTSEGHYTVREA
jgi:hypothetical protein